MNERINTGSLHRKGGYVYNIYIVNHSCCEVPRFISLTRDQNSRQQKIIQASSVPQFEASAIFCTSLEKEVDFFSPKFHG